MTNYIQHDNKLALVQSLGTEVTSEEAREHLTEYPSFGRRDYAPEQEEGDEVIVVWADNGPFQALGIIEGERDFSGFEGTDDPRPIKFFKVKHTDIYSYSDGFAVDAEEEDKASDDNA